MKGEAGLLKKPSSICLRRTGPFLPSPTDVITAAMFSTYGKPYRVGFLLHSVSHNQTTKGNRGNHSQEIQWCNCNVYNLQWHFCTSAPSTNSISCRSQNGSFQTMLQGSSYLSQAKLGPPYLRRWVLPRSAPCRPLLPPLCHPGSHSPFFFPLASQHESLRCTRTFSSRDCVCGFLLTACRPLVSCHLFREVFPGPGPPHLKSPSTAMLHPLILLFFLAFLHQLSANSKYDVCVL